MQTTFRFGSVSAAEALAAASSGQAKARLLTDTVDKPASNGFPGFDEIWNGVWGVAKGILTNTSNPASTTVVAPHDTAMDKAIPIASLAVVGVLGALLIMQKPKRRK